MRLTMQFSMSLVLEQAKLNKQHAEMFVTIFKRVYKRCSAALATAVADQVISLRLAAIIVG